MKKLLFTAITTILLLSSCEPNNPPTPPVSVDRVLMVYMAADNNLDEYVEENIDGLIEGIKTSATNNNHSRVLLYLDMPNTLPKIIEITTTGEKELFRWSEHHNSASVLVVREAIGKMKTLAPATRYGLVMWSHGMAWTPSSANSYFIGKSRAADIWPATKYFGQDTGVSPIGYLETNDIVAAIPDGIFDYILFDACFMASIEVQYAIRKKADYIIATPTELIATGFPYTTITAELLKTTPDLSIVCKNFFDRYVQDPDTRYHSASVSLVKTSELDNFATATNKLYEKALEFNPTIFSNFDISKVQPLDRYRRNFLFDIGSVVRQLNDLGAISSAQKTEWNEQLNRTVIYEAHTPIFFNLPIKECCGLSTYIPIAAYPDLNQYYNTLDWYKIVMN